MKIRTRAVSWKSTFRLRRHSIWFVVFSPCILLQPTSHTYDYYQFVIIVAVTVVVVAAAAVIHWFIYFNCTFAMLYRFLACPMHAQLMAGTNRNSGRYASPFDHLSVIHYSPPLSALRTFSFHVQWMRAARTPIWKLWENVRRTDCRCCLMSNNGDMFSSSIFIFILFITVSVKRWMSAKILIHSIRTSFGWIQFQTMQLICRSGGDRIHDQISCKQIDTEEPRAQS